WWLFNGRSINSTNVFFIYYRRSLWNEGNRMTIALLFGTMFLLVFIGVPIALSLGIALLVTMAVAINSFLSFILHKSFTSLYCFLMAVRLIQQMYFLFTTDDLYGTEERE